MPDSRSSRIRVLVAEQAGRRGARAGVVDVCTAAVASLPVGGAGVSAMFRTAASDPLCSTDDISEQLTALNSRVLIEQAKGKLAERQGIDMEQALSAPRAYARSHNRRLSDVARAFVDDTEPLAGLTS
ncbi:MULTISPECIES: ANTAR domain-containing protein [unclassified Streptomyces]|uniref:ANTAR domain-containing protein n=1 Tax=Streptomyces sp. NBC_00060 TaxID=2975636 RepID=A0AAU2GTX9_9ACTN